MVRGARWIRFSMCAVVALAASCAESESEAPPVQESARTAASEVAPASPAIEEMDAFRAAMNEERVPIPDPPPAEDPLDFQPFLFIDVNEQLLTLFVTRDEGRQYPISTSKAGVGSRAGSLRTPLGHHRVAEKFGDGAPLGTIFRSRANTGEVAKILTEPIDVEEDLVLTRILWLEGLEPGVNQGPGIDSKERYIYIHGTNEEGLIGTPASHGCIRMKNADVIALYELVPVGTDVIIEHYIR